ncbi:MAG: DUF2309 domain-containing protein [Flavobacteriia bacterium]|nr:DUF2309 domain-containing protein [Flavobacteriia bacterium]NBO60561.1 DUF2309 domain-containing protein [Flavobacteriia bacterium]
MFSQSLDAILHRIVHYLPSQAPLKDFIHHNTLHAFQSREFHQALADASKLYGYQTYLQLSEYRNLYKVGEIQENQLFRGLEPSQILSWQLKLFKEDIDENVVPELGQLRAIWKSYYKIDMDSLVFPLLFRITLSYLDQGISSWHFPSTDQGFLNSIRTLEQGNLVSFFKTPRAKKILQDKSSTLETLLKIVVGDHSYNERYLFDQQFAHPGYAGMVAVLEGNPQLLVNRRDITLRDFIFLELLLEIDALDNCFGEVWAPISFHAQGVNPSVNFTFVRDELDLIKERWQEALEWTYYDQVLNGIKKVPVTEKHSSSFQAVLCIDDRECSLRRYMELINPDAETFGTPGFFNLACYFQPAHSEQRIKICPAPIVPQIVVKEVLQDRVIDKELHFSDQVNHLLFGWILTQTYGFISGFKLIRSIWNPSKNKVAVSSSRHMHPNSELQYEFTGAYTDDGLQLGFTLDDMAIKLFELLMSIGLINHFSTVVYLIGHGSSSANNTHYAGYDCGACSGRPGSVNARIMATIANRQDVREKLKEMGLIIPETTQFVGVLHDTSRDEFTYYDLDNVSQTHLSYINEHKKEFEMALEMNAAERSRRFETLTVSNLKKNHKKVKLRSLSFFEPRPELNHATNSLCVVGRRVLTKGLNLDRRSFLNSYDYRSDPNGIYLAGILNAVAPVCGGINLEYFFSRVDNNNLGAGTKLPHNVMGLIGVANGIDGDLRTGLPNQMIEIHTPIRLLTIVEHWPYVVADVLQKNPKTMEWFRNQWINLIVYHPFEKQFYLFKEGIFHLYKPTNQRIEEVDFNIMDFMQRADNHNVELVKSLAL